MYQKRKALENLIIALLDILCLFASFIIAFYLRYHKFLQNDAGLNVEYILGYVFVLDIVIELFRDGYRHFFRRGMLIELKNVMMKNILLALFFMALLFALHSSEDISRLVVGYALIANVFLSWICRCLFKRYMLKEYKGGRHSSKVLLVTDSLNAEKIIKGIEAYNDWYHRLSAIALLDGAAGKTKIAGYPIVADANTLMDYCIHQDVDEVVFISPLISKMTQSQTWLKQMVEMGIKVDFDIEIFGVDLVAKRTIDRIGKYSVAVFMRNEFSNRDMAAKRMMDIVGSLVGMVILAVATVFVAPAIKLESPGPVFFGQKRVGKNGRIFTIYKFRSMYQNAEERKKELMAQNEVDGLMFKMTDDPRITKVGRFIRRTSIDELPQFWNVLKGDMSLVGTRPPTADEFEHYETKHKCRLSMTPGLTGLWQISGRSNIKDFEEVVRLDMQYIDNWSIGLDIRIILKTIVTVMTGRGSR